MPLKKFPTVFNTCLKRKPSSSNHASRETLLLSSNQASREKILMSSIHASRENPLLSRNQASIENLFLSSKQDDNNHVLTSWDLDFLGNSILIVTCWVLVDL
jgi:hypothetical protein